MYIDLNTKSNNKFLTDNNNLLDTITNNVTELSEFTVNSTVELYTSTDKLQLPIKLNEFIYKIHNNIENYKDFKDSIIKSIPKDFTTIKSDKLYHRQLSILRLKRVLKLQKEQYKKTPKDYLKQVIDAIKLTIAYHKNPTEELRKAARSAAGSAAWSAAAAAVGSAAWSAARSAAESAWSAARSAAESAAESAVGSAAWSAWSAAGSAAWSAAARSAAAAESAAWSATWSAAYMQEAEDLIRLLQEIES